MNNSNIQKIVDSFVNDKSNGRYKSWEICHKKFCEFKDKEPNEKEIELLSLHLIGYLASWGMYRGSSALLRDFDYTVHEELISKLLMEENRKLFTLNPLENTNEFLCLLNSVYNDIKKYYEKLENNEGKHMKPSKTLITKILLGVYGCIPAYDRNVVSALRKNGINVNDFSCLIEKIKCSQDFIEQCKSCLEIYPEYTLMKIIDVCLWEKGKRLEEKKK